MNAIVFELNKACHQSLSSYIFKVKLTSRSNEYVSISKHAVVLVLRREMKPSSFTLKAKVVF
jgi:hypothetical protein